MTGWQPANDSEREMARALAADDRAGFFRIVAETTLYLPQSATARDEPGAQTFVTADLFGQTFLPVFTSMEAMLPQVTGIADAYTVTDYAELREKWPSPAWRLAVNPGTPLDAYVAVETVEEAAAVRATVPDAAEALQGVAEEDALAEMDDADRVSAERHLDTPDGLLADFGAATAGTPGPAPDTDALLRAAAGRGDAVAFIAALLDAMVHLPTTGPVDDPARVVDADFPWRVVGHDGEPAIEVFTSERLMTAAHPARPPYLTVTLVSLLTVWPEEHLLLVNPGTDLSVTVPADQVPAMLLFPDQDPTS
ncbi:SseB family protein [Polymorphospora sp. NPDC051019]|uniref:SseB family protein n=1 Tax=Polymorphospora sp. NPDC051019 TaxID=3155725 RepID=UPI0034185833